jgi:hypothetical protein
MVIFSTRATLPVALASRALGVQCAVYRRRDDGLLEVGAPVLSSGPTSDPPATAAARQGALLDSMDPAIVACLYPRAARAGSATQLVGVRLEQKLRSLGPLLAPGAQDAIGIVAGDPSGHGVVVHAMRRARSRLAPGERQLWTRVAAHIAAGYRLRRGMPSADAVLSPSGRVEHAEGAATGAPERAALGEGARDRSSARQAAPRRRPRGRRSLHKMIAYDLGIGVSTVGTHLKRAARKLGLRSRLELSARSSRCRRASKSRELTAPQAPIAAARSPRALQR